MARVTCTISGSFQRFLDEIARRMDECAAQGIEVRSPRTTVRTGESGGFVFLEGDGSGPRHVEEQHLQCIARSDFVYVVDPEGYVGTSTSLEIGYAVARGIPVFFSDAPADGVLSTFGAVEPTIARIKDSTEAGAVPSLPPRSDLPSLQSYVREMVAARGFEDESIRDVMLLLVEETGELAKAIRRAVGLKVAVPTTKGRKRLEDELADCLIYLLDIANLAGVDLEAAFRRKEELNASKVWAVDAGSEDSR